MNDNAKAFLAIGIPACAIALVYGLSRRKQPSGPAGKLSIQVIPGVRYAIPNNLTEGMANNTARVFITNNSFKGTNTPVPYTFTVKAAVFVGGVWLTLRPASTQKISLGASEADKPLDFLFDIPENVLGNGLASAVLFTEDGATQIGSQVTTSFTVSELAITPAGSIRWYQKHENSVKRY